MEYGEYEEYLSRHRFPLGTAVAVYFKEEGGYLYLHSLGAGAHGQISLVRPVDDGFHADNPTLFARKRALGQLPGGPTPIDDEQYPVTDYVYPGRPHPCVPEVFPPVFFGNDAYPPGFPGHAVRQRFCNGGSLFQLRLKCNRARFVVPEAFIWTLLTQLTETLLWLHQAGLTHGDVHCRNIYLHYRTATSSSPEVFLGDFGNAGSATPTRLRLEFKDMVGAIKSLIACHVGHAPGGDRDPHHESTWAPYSGLLQRTLDRIAVAVSGGGYGDQLSPAIHETVRVQFARWKDTGRCSADPCVRASVAWTRPPQAIAPLFFDEKGLADLMRGRHPRFRELYGDGDGAGNNPLQPMQGRGVIEPWEFALVDRRTLAIIGVLTDEEVREHVRVWGAVRSFEDAVEEEDAEEEIERLPLLRLNSWSLPRSSSSLEEGELMA